MPKKITINGFSYDWGVLLPRFRKIREELPQQLAAVAQNFFVDSFQRQGWYDGLTLKRWKPRKVERWRRKKQNTYSNKREIEDCACNKMIFTVFYPSDK